ncbi:MAG: ABC transporter substrate-binding protein [Dehalococcoidia bacterium]
MRLHYIVPVLGLLLAVAAIACSGDGQGSTPTPSAVEEAVAAPSAVTVTDSNGKQVTFEAPPGSIVALAPSFAEILFAIGAGDAIAAVDQNTDFPPEAAAKEKLSGFEPSVEGVAALEPDLVVIFFDPGGLEAALEGLGIPVLFLTTPASIQGVFDQIELLGQATGHAQEAGNLIAEMQDGIDAITEKLADIEEGPSFFHELDPTLFTTCPGEFIHDMYETLKARNVATDAGVPCQLTEEAVIAGDPEVIVLADSFAGENMDTVKARPGWSSVAAVQNDRLHVHDPDIVSRPGPRLVEALEILAAYLYPERFP